LSVAAKTEGGLKILDCRQAKPAKQKQGMKMKWRKSFSETKNNLVEIKCAMLK